MKEINGWVVIMPKGIMIYQTFRRTRADAKAALMTFRTWKESHAIGFRVVRATLRAEE